MRVKGRRVLLASAAVVVVVAAATVGRAPDPGPPAGASRAPAPGLPAIPAPAADAPPGLAPPGTDLGSVPVASAAPGDGAVDGAEASGGRTPAPASAPAAGARAATRDRQPGTVAPQAAADPPQPASVGDGPPAPAGPIVLGAVVRENTAAAAAALGLAVSGGTPGAWIRTLVDDLNRRGGIGGRPVEVVVHAVDASTSSGFASEEQAACETFTRDTGAVAVLATADVSDLLRGCLEDRGIPFVGARGTAADAQTLRDHPSSVEVNTLNLSRVARLQVEDFVARGFLGPDDRIGLVRLDAPSFERAERDHLVPALAAAGLELAATALVRPDSSSAVVTDAQAAASRFALLGIDRVLFLDIRGGLFTFFAQFAEGIGYRPAYGLTSHSGMDVAVTARTAPVAQLRRAVGIGWMPVNDVEGSPLPGPQAQRCRELLEAGGAVFDDRNALNNGLAHCDLVWFVEAALTASPGASGPGRVVAGAEALGTGYASAFTFATRFAPDRHDGAAEVRPTAFLDDCTCFRHVGAARAD